MVKATQFQKDQARLIIENRDIEESLEGTLRDVRDGDVSESFADEVLSLCDDKVLDYNYRKRA